MKHSNAHELSVSTLLQAWLDYAEAHEDRYGSPIGDDYILGNVWADLGRSIHGLLDGETGRIDCGVVSHSINAALKANGYGLYDEPTTDDDEAQS